MTNVKLAAFGIAVCCAMGTRYAQPDARFVRMWEISQRARPAVLASVSRVADDHERGTRLVIHGLVLDRSGRPAPGVEVFAYHTDAGGTYAPSGAADPWRLKGWIVTDAQGRFEFRTIRPAPYPGHTVPAHVHTIVTTECCGRQFTDLMFDDDPLATTAYRDRYDEIGEHGLYAAVTRRADQTEEVSYTIRIREHGNF